jgi:hypothetical protein
VAGTAVEIASSAADGPLVQSVSPATLATLAVEYFSDYQSFLATAEGLVNAAVTGAENDLPEGAQVQLVLTGLTGPFGGSLAGQMAGAITQAWARGQIVNVDGTTLQPWPGAGAVAYPDDASATLTLRWIKGQPWVWVLVGVLLAVTAIAVYTALRNGGYSMSTLSAGASVVSWAVRNWWVFPVGAAALAILPFATREVRAEQRALRS